MQRFLRIIILSLCLAILSGSSMAFARERLVFAVTLIRHGDRAPVHEMPASPCNWIPGLGELTPLGINQEYLLGQSLRTRYVNQFGLLPPKYQYNSIYACSTDYNRTIMSAQALLCGLYPPGTGPLLDDGLPALPSACQPIPVRTTPEDRDRILRWQEDNKERLREILRTTVFTTVEWQKMSASAAHKFSRWSQIFGVRIENLLDLIPPGDNVNVRLLKGISLPVGLTEAEAREIVKLSQWAMAQECRPQKIGRLIAGNFLQKVITDMQKAIEGTQEYKFILYSGHDSNILPVMAALGTPLEATPPYASNVCFELYQDKDEYSVKVRYNGEDLALPGAGGRTDCTFKQFMTAVLEESR